MRKLLLFVLMTCMFMFSAIAGFEGLQDGASLKIFNQIDCSTGLTCTRVKGKFKMVADGTFEGDIIGDGGDTLYGFRQNRISATTTTITVAECGSTFINDLGAVQIELPEASIALGCRLTFIGSASSSNFDINPDDADIILVQTNAVGDAMRSSGSSTAITIESASSGSWQPISVVGTWSDIN